MFTGLVERTGLVSALCPSGEGHRLQLRAQDYETELGASVAVNGVCLTVTESDKQSFCTDISAETLECTTLGTLKPGVTVNLERALRMGGRLGGHLMTGHVDGTAHVKTIQKVGTALRVDFRYPDRLAAFIAEKGSVAVDGVSLTVNGVLTSTFWVMLVPHTLSATTLAQLHVGQSVNLEIDVIARYVARRLEVTHAGAQDQKEKTLLDALSRGGYWPPE